MAFYCNYESQMSMVCGKVQKVHKNFQVGPLDYWLNTSIIPKTNTSRLYTSGQKNKFINPFSLPISPPKSKFSYIHWKTPKIIIIWWTWLATPTNGFHSFHSIKQIAKWCCAWCFYIHYEGCKISCFVWIDPCFFVTCLSIFVSMCWHCNFNGWCPYIGW